MNPVPCRRVTVGVIVLVLSFASATADWSPRETAPAAIAHTSSSSTPAAREMTREQRENLEERVAVTLGIVERLGGDAKRRGLGHAWRQVAFESLLPLSLDALREVEQEAHTLDTLAGAARTVGGDPSLLGDPNTDLVYRPIAPCRYIDTRLVAGKLAGVRPYDLAANGATYGGTAACTPVSLFGVGDDQIAAVAMNVTIVNPSTAPGFVAVKPSAAAPTVSLLNWYESGSSVQAANQGIVTTLQDPAALDEFVIESSAPVHVIVDLFGAFVAGPSHQFVTATGGAPTPGASLQFLGVPVTITVGSAAQRVFVVASRAFGTTVGATGLNLFMCVQNQLGPGPIQQNGNGIAGLQLPPGTKSVQTLTKVLQLPTGTYKVAMCGQGGSGWNNNDWGMTSAFAF